MSTIIINISKRSYSTRGRALGIAKQAISRELNVLTNPSGDPLFWTLDNVVVEEAEDGWRWHVEIDMPSTDSAMAEIEAQEEAPRELTVEQALEIAAQHTEAVDEEFRAVEARHRAEATVSVSPRQEDLAQLTNPSAKQPEHADETFQHMLDFNQSDIDVATDMGRDALETAIERLEDTLRGLKRRLEDYNLALRSEAHGKGDYLAWAANDLRNADFNDLRLVLAEQAGKLKALGTARIHIWHFRDK